MAVIVCDQFAILGDGCPGCGFWLHREVRGGYPDPHGVRHCSEDCLADQAELVIRNHIDAHYGSRDLLCACKICTDHGLPTQAILAEYAAYVESIKGTPLDPTAQSPATEETR
jgi:hypothetical protein